MTKTCNKQNQLPKTSQNEFHIIDQKAIINWYLDNVHKTLRDIINLKFSGFISPKKMYFNFFFENLNKRTQNSDCTCRKLEN